MTRDDGRWPEDLWQRLRRRRLFRWTLAFAALAWTLLQVVGFFVDAFGWSPFVTRAAAIVLSLGLPAVIVLAWFHGEQGRQRVGYVEATLLAAILIAMAVLLRYAALENRGTANSQPAAIAAALEARRHRIAILPLDSVGSDDADATLAGGIHETLITQVAKVPGLSVLSQGAVSGFATNRPETSEIAERLDVGAILEGSVQRSGTRLRIQARLVDTATNVNLWAETFDRTTNDIFAVQSEIAGAVAEQLRIRLSTTDVDRLRRAPSVDPRAYEAYVNGRHYLRKDDWSRAIAALSEATKLDPAFAEAWARLAIAHVDRGWAVAAERDAEFALARAALAQARVIEPGLPSVHLATAMYEYRVTADYETAALAFERAVDGLPNDADAFLYFGQLRRRQGQWLESALLFERVAALEPTQVPGPLIGAYLRLDQRADAERLAERARAASPADEFAQFMPALIRWLVDCDLDSVEAVVEQLEPDGFQDGGVQVRVVDFLLTTGRPERARRLLEDGARRFPDYFNDSEFDLATALSALGRDAEARALLGPLTVAIEGRLDGDVPILTRVLAAAQLARVRAALGDAAAARATSGRALEWLNSAKVPEFDVHSVLADIAAAYVAIGDHDAAVGIIERMVATPSASHKPARLWCSWELAPLRSHAPYRDLMRRRGVDVSIDPASPSTWPKRATR